MGDLNNIQNEIAAEMLGDLADVSYPFTGTGIRSNNAPYDPDDPLAGQDTLTYTGTIIGGLSFNQRDLAIFQIQANDQKSILMKVNSTGTPETGDKVSFNDAEMEIIALVKLSADNGWTLQLRSYG